MAPAASTDRPNGPRDRPRRYVPLLHRVAAINALLLLLAVGLTIVILVPGHQSSYRIDEEGVLLVGRLSWWWC